MLTTINNSIIEIVNPIDLSMIREKTHVYTGFNEFYVDICWLVHNCVVMYSGDFSHQITTTIFSHKF